MENKLIITNGDFAAEKIKLLFPEAEVLPWRDVLHEGPVLHYDDPETCSAVRAEFISEFANVPTSQIITDFQMRDQCLKDAILSDCIVELWFEHDLYDQLQILQILAYARCWIIDKPIFLIQADSYLTEYNTQDLYGLVKQRRVISSEQNLCAWSLWEAYCRGQLAEFLGKEAQTLKLLMPHMSTAMLRLLKEYPDSRTGLPLSITNALTALLQKASLPIETLFLEMQSKEEAKFMGDLGFVRQIHRLLREEQPLVSTENGIQIKSWRDINIQQLYKTSIHLTDWGKEVLSGKKSRLVPSELDYWLGGKHFKAQ